MSATKTLPSLGTRNRQTEAESLFWATLLFVDTVSLVPTPEHKLSNLFVAFSSSMCCLPSSGEVTGSDWSQVPVGVKDFP